MSILFTPNRTAILQNFNMNMLADCTEIIDLKYGYFVLKMLCISDHFGRN
jgi:hypothetical protein